MNQKHLNTFVMHLVKLELMLTYLPHSRGFPKLCNLIMLIELV